MFHYIIELAYCLLGLKLKRCSANNSSHRLLRALHWKSTCTDYKSVNLLRLIRENGIKLATELVQSWFHTESPLSSYLPLWSDLLNHKLHVPCYSSDPKITLYDITMTIICFLMLISHWIRFRFYVVHCY